MSLNTSVSAAERAKLAVWSYPVSDKYTNVKLLDNLLDGRLSLLDVALHARIEAARVGRSSDRPCAQQ